MDEWIRILLSPALLLARASGFLGVAPIFGTKVIPMPIRASFAILITIFFAMVTPPAAPARGAHWVGAAVLIVQEVLCGAGLGLAARLAYMGIQQGGRIAGRQMGMMMAGVVDPNTGERSQPLGVLFDMSFTILFLIAGGHHLLLIMLGRSYDVMPVAGSPDLSALTEGVIAAGSVMLLFALKLAAPVLAAFLVLAIVLAILARILPEMNLLMTSMPFRAGLGLFMAAAILPLLEGFTVEIADWMKRFLIA